MQRGCSQDRLSKQRTTKAESGSSSNAMSGSDQCDGEDHWCRHTYYNLQGHMARTDEWTPVHPCIASRYLRPRGCTQRQGFRERSHSSQQGKSQHAGAQGVVRERTVGLSFGFELAPQRPLVIELPVQHAQRLVHVLVMPAPFSFIFRSEVKGFMLMPVVRSCASKSQLVFHPGGMGSCAS